MMRDASSRARLSNFAIHYYRTANDYLFLSTPYFPESLDEKDSFTYEGT